MKPDSIALTWLLALVFSAALASGDTQVNDTGRAMNDTICLLIQLIQMISVAVAALMMILAGVKFLIADNPSGRSEAKNWIIHTFAGLIIIFIAVHIVNVVTAQLTGAVECKNLLTGMQRQAQDKPAAPNNAQKPTETETDSLWSDKPDLIVSDIKIPTQDEITVNALPIYVEIANTGKLAADTFEVTLAIETETYINPQGNPHCSARTKNALPAGEKTTIKCVFTPDINLANTLNAEGQHNIIALADSLDEITESNEDNNIQTLPLNAKVITPEQTLKIQTVTQEVQTNTQSEVCKKCCKPGEMGCHIRYTDENNNEALHQSDELVIECGFITENRKKRLAVTQETFSLKWTIGSVECLTCDDGTPAGSCNEDKEMCVWTGKGTVYERKKVPSWKTPNCEGDTITHLAGQFCQGSDCPCENNPDKLCCTGGKWTKNQARYDQMCAELKTQSFGCGTNKCGPNEKCGDKACDAGYMCVDSGLLGCECRKNSKCCSGACGETSCGTAATQCGTGQKCADNPDKTDCICQPAIDSCCGTGHCGVTNCDDENCQKDVCTCEKSGKPCAYFTDKNDLSCIEKVCGITCPGKTTTCAQNERCMLQLESWNCIGDNTCNIEVPIIAGQTCTGTDCPCESNPEGLCCKDGKWTKDEALYDQLCAKLEIMSSGPDKPVSNQDKDCQALCGGIDLPFVGRQGAVPCGYGFRCGSDNKCSFSSSCCSQKCGWDDNACGDYTCGTFQRCVSSPSGNECICIDSTESCGSEYCAVNPYTRRSSLRNPNDPDTFLMKGPISSCRDYLGNNNVNLIDPENICKTNPCKFAGGCVWTWDRYCISCEDIHSCADYSPDAACTDNVCKVELPEGCRVKMVREYEKGAPYSSSCIKKANNDLEVLVAEGKLVSGEEAWAAYDDWLLNYVKNGGKVTRCEWEPIANTGNIFYLAKGDFDLQPLYGAQAISIVVPKGISYPKGDLGHNTLYLVDGYRSISRAAENVDVPAYTDTSVRCKY